MNLAHFYPLLHILSFTPPPLPHLPHPSSLIHHPSTLSPSTLLPHILSFFPHSSTLLPHLSFLISRPHTSSLSLAPPPPHLISASVLHHLYPSYLIRLPSFLNTATLPILPHQSSLTFTLSSLTPSPSSLTRTPHLSYHIPRPTSPHLSQPFSLVPSL